MAAPRENQIMLARWKIHWKRTPGPRIHYVVKYALNCAPIWVQSNVARWKRCGVIVVMYAYDHPPAHVHVYEDGKHLLKFDIENWLVLEGHLTAKAKRALAALRREGKL